MAHEMGQFYAAILKGGQVSHEQQEAYLSRLQELVEREGRLQECQPQMLTLSSPIMEEEVRAAIVAGKGRSAPGPDGLTYGFYKAFEKLLMPVLTHWFNEALEKGELPATCYQAKELVGVSWTDRGKSFVLKTVVHADDLNLLGGRLQDLAVLTNHLRQYKANSWMLRWTTGAHPAPPRRTQAALVGLPDHLQDLAAHVMTYHLKATTIADVQVQGVRGDCTLEQYECNICIAVSLTVAVVDRLLVMRQARGPPVAPPEWLAEDVLCNNLQMLVRLTQEGKSPHLSFQGSDYREKETMELTAEQFADWMTLNISCLQAWAVPLSPGPSRPLVPVTGVWAVPVAPCPPSGGLQGDDDLAVVSDRPPLPSASAECVVATGVSVPATPAMLGTPEVSPSTLEEPRTVTGTVFQEAAGHSCSTQLAAGWSAFHTVDEELLESYFAMMALDEDAAAQDGPHDPVGPQPGTVAPHTFVIRVRYRGPGPDVFFNRERFVGQFLLKTMKVPTAHLWAISIPPGQAKADVIFQTEVAFHAFWRVWCHHQRVGSPLIDQLEAQPLFRGELHVIIVYLRSDEVPADDLTYRMARTGRVLMTPQKIMDSYGVWTCEYKLVMQLECQLDGRLRNLPRYFFLGGDCAVVRCVNVWDLAGFHRHREEELQCERWQEQQRQQQQGKMAAHQEEELTSSASAQWAAGACPSGGACSCSGQSSERAVAIAVCDGQFVFSPGPCLGLWGLGGTSGTGARGHGSLPFQWLVRCFCGTPALSLTMVAQSSAGLTAVALPLAVPLVDLAPPSLDMVDLPLASQSVALASASVCCVRLRTTWSACGALDAYIIDSRCLMPIDSQYLVSSLIYVLDAYIMDSTCTLGVPIREASVAYLFPWFFYAVDIMTAY
uniref:Uncharacterized protein n=1 Tax=Sphaerodactylus townsendi TaxID=933632 RepID=A0ACB8ECB0_9SAUR